ncbi:MAG: hypothetical protein AAFZ01_00920 [Pseudomonadota bacterium]
MTQTLKKITTTAVLALALTTAAQAGGHGGFYGDGPVGDYPDWAQKVLFDTSN